MKKRSIVIPFKIPYTAPIMLFLLSCASSLFALDVDRTELSSTRDTAVEFINYEGPHSKIETLDQIMAIGIFLGESIGKGYSTASYAGKYRVIHALGESPDEGLEADIFMVLQGAEVDHIRNLRYIIAGFLIAAYNYDKADALLIAEFVTIYNAVYRGKMDFLGGKYRQIVTRNLRPEAVGISTFYTEWPGKTEMVIPLTEGATEGGIGSLNTDVLTDEKVVEQMRTQDDMGLESRKAITELKEREVEQQQQKIEQEQAALGTEKERIAAAQEKIQVERAQVQQERAKAGSDAERAAAAEKEAALKVEEEKLKTEEAGIAKREGELAASVNAQAERIDKIQSEREGIAADERTLIEQEAKGADSQTASAAGSRGSRRIILFLEIRELGGEALGRLVQIDPASGAIIGASSLNSIRNRGVESFGSQYVVVAGTTSGQGAVRLMTLDKESLETGREGADNIYPGSALLVDGATLFAVTGEEGVWKIAKFDNTLALRELSDIEVFQDTAITLAESMIYVVGADGAIHMLSMQDLADAGTIR